MDEWLTASKSLVNLEANSAINKATSLATAINQLAVGGSSASQMSGDGTTLPATTITSFWVALGEKAQMSTDRITTVKNAERAYYGSTAWTEVVNGVTVNHANGTRGMLDARRDFEVNVSQATATLNKATMHASGERDRSIATAAWNLAQSRNTYETSWAALDLDSSGWSLGDSSLVMMGFGGSSTATTTTTTNTTTVTTTGSGTGTTSNTSTGVSPSVSSGASYFTRLFTETGATQDGPNKPPSSGSQIPGTQTNPQTNPAPPTVPVAVGQNDAGDDDPRHEPPATRSIPLILWTGSLPVEGEDPGTILVMPPKASPLGPWDVSVTPPGDLNLYNPFVFPFGPSPSQNHNPFDFGMRQRYSEVAKDDAESETVVIILAVPEIPQNSPGLATAELDLTELEVMALEAEAEAVADELRETAGQVTMEELFKITLAPGETATYDWKLVQEQFLARYGEEGIAALMYLHEQGWQIKESNYWSAGWHLTHDHWPDLHTNTIYINRGDWLNVASRSEWNVAGQLHDSIMQAIAEQQKAVRQMEQWELTEKHYPNEVFLLRFLDDVMLNVNTSTLEWLEGESMDGRVLTPEEQSGRGWEAAGSFGMLVLIGSGLKLPGAAVSAESLAGRGLVYRILNAPIGSSVAAGARAATTRLGGVVIANPRVAALVTRLRELQNRLAALRNGGRSINLRNHPPGHHSLIPHGGNGRVTLRGFFGNQFGRFVPRVIRDSRFNLIGPDSQRLFGGRMFADGDAYRLWHYRVDPHYFPRGWRALGPKYGLPGRLWYGSPEAIRGTVIVLGAGNVGVRVYVMIMDDEE